MDNFLLLLLIAILCYLIGSFPTAYVVGRLNGINIFEIGSGNMGATNIVRSLGYGWGASVLLIDLGKGILAVLAARPLLPGDAAAASVIGALGVVVGHNWSLFATLLTGRIRGGKGAATSGGTWLVMFMPWWYLVVIPLAVCIAVVALTRYVSLAVLTTTTVALIGALLGISVGIANIPPVYAVYAIVIALMIFYRHRENIQRLLAGRERRLGDPA